MFGERMGLHTNCETNLARGQLTVQCLACPTAGRSCALARPRPRGSPHPPKYQIMRIVSPALARVSESHGGKPRRRLRRRSRRGGLSRILQNTPLECSCSTNNTPLECSCSTNNTPPGCSCSTNNTPRECSCSTFYVLRPTTLARAPSWRGMSRTKSVAWPASSAA